MTPALPLILLLATRLSATVLGHGPGPLAPQRFYPVELNGCPGRLESGTAHGAPDQAMAGLEEAALARGLRPAGADDPAYGRGLIEALAKGAARSPACRAYASHEAGEVAGVWQDRRTGRVQWFRFSAHCPPGTAARWPSMLPRPPGLAEMFTVRLGRGDCWHAGGRCPQDAADLAGWLSPRLWALGYRAAHALQGEEGDAQLWSKPGSLLLAWLEDDPEGGCRVALTLTPTR